MGQQQLLIVILVTIIIGIASIVAITTFDSAAETANRDAIVNDLNTLASEAQDYYLRPITLSGGGRSFDGFTIQGKLLPVSGISGDGLFTQTENGTLEVASITGNILTIIGHPSSCEGYQSGTIDEEGTLTNAGSCSDSVQITATVSLNEIMY